VIAINHHHGQQAREKEERAKLLPSEMFLSQSDLYSRFDETGLPTHDKVRTVRHTADHNVDDGDDGMGAVDDCVNIV